MTQRSRQLVELTTMGSAIGPETGMSIIAAESSGALLVLHCAAKGADYHQKYINFDVLGESKLPTYRSHICISLR